MRASSSGGPEKGVRAITRWIGLDCHTTSVTVAILEEGSKKARHRRFDNTEAAWAGFCREEVNVATHLVLEASGGAWPIYDRLNSAGAAEILVAHPLRVKAIAAARVKSDRVDARTLAELGRAGLIPAVWVPSPQERTLRTLVRRRVSVARVATGQKNQVCAALRRQGIRAAKPRLFTDEGQRFLAQLVLPRGEDVIVAGAQNLLQWCEVQQTALEAEIAAIVRDGEPAFRADVQRLMTVPGVDLLTAVATRARLGDVRRFRNGRFAAAYIGLTPRVRQSGATQRTGAITKQGDRVLRALLCQAAWATVRSGSRFRRRFEHLCARKGPKIAIVAIARRLLMLLFTLLRTQTPYQAARPSNVRQKEKRLARLPRSYWDAFHQAHPVMVNRARPQQGTTAIRTSRRPAAMVT